jgi:CHAT domain-containing protein
VVLIHTLSTEDTLYILLTTPEVLLVRSSPVGNAELEKKVAELRRLLREPTSDPTPVAQILYNWIISPVADELRAADSKTLMFSLDGALRYIPMTVLHDGKKWLIERYSIAIFTEATRDLISFDAKFSVQAEALGITHVKNFPPLPAVRNEVEAIVRTTDEEKGVLPGKRLLDREFTYDELSNDLLDGYPVIHIASHFYFDPITPKNSFLLLGDGTKLTLSQLDDATELPFTDVDQLTLSACETAFGVGKGDGREAEGFGALAQDRGAHSVIATLWPVADKSTGILMQDFYHLRFIGKQNKAAALRQAQLHLMGHGSRGDVAHKRGVAVSTAQASGTTNTSPSKFTGYAHPYYWAPFILMGNWK